MPSGGAAEYRKHGLKEYKAEKWEAAVSAFDKVSARALDPILVIHA